MASTVAISISDRPCSRSMWRRWTAAGNTLLHQAEQLVCQVPSTRMALNKCLESVY
jgi:hypothetical protein